MNLRQLLSAGVKLGFSDDSDCKAKIYLPTTLYPENQSGDSTYVSPVLSMDAQALMDTDTMSRPFERTTMKLAKFLPFAYASMLAMPVLAQSVATEVQRDVNQQKRIEAGLQTGVLTTREAARLEKEEARISRTEANALSDGKLNSQERRRIARMENRASRDISAQAHDDQAGNTNSVSSQRMQADVARNIHQQERIEAGIKDGSLTNREVGRLERGESRIDGREAAAGRDGHVGVREQARIQRNENRESNHIHRQRHDRQQRG
ncbi:hypothetical protein [Noviherbaspirillum humi]|nr:hypothetical protein [Noviherbaspirillum humi]